MGLALFKDRRGGDRKRLTGLLPGRLLLASNNLDLVCRPTDVSAHGMGVVVIGDNKKIAIGTELLLVLPEQTLRLKITWIRADFGKQDATRYGIVTSEGSCNLEALFESSGCLR